MHPVAIGFGLACGAACVLSCYAKPEERADATFLALILVESWAISNLAWLADNLGTICVFDGIVAGLARWIWRWRGGDWRLWFRNLAYAQFALDLAYAWYGPAFVVAYLYLLDLTFAAEIIIISWGGGKHVFRHLRRGGLLGVRDLLPIRRRQSG